MAEISSALRGLLATYEKAYLYRQLFFYHKIGAEENDEIKLGPVDLEMLNYAKNMLLDELAISYSQPRDAVEGFVEKRIASL